jgi:beta-N-acetylhexosaminidase
MPRRTLIVLAMFLLTSAAVPKTKYQPMPLHLNRDGEKWAEKTLHKMSVEEKVGQLFMIWVRAEFLNAGSPEYLKLRDEINRYHIGSFAMSVPYEPPFLYKSGPYEAASLLNRLQSDSKLPLLIAADFEVGAGNRINGATGFPAAMAIGATGKLNYAEAFGRISGEEARAIGVHWNFFPVADVNSNPENPIINTRSFGEDPQQVGDFVAAYTRGAHSAGMLVTAKHFPGHGDTASDSHLGLAKVDGSLQRLESVELPPFKKAIASGVDAIMVAHVNAPALDPAPNSVATVSPAIVTGLLREKLQFSGVIITDALDMAGLTRLYAGNIGRAAVDAFKAGNDMLLIPPDLDAADRAMIAAVQSGEISQARLDESVLKILKVKASLGLNKARLVDLTALDSAIGKPENVAQGQQIADDSVTMVRRSGSVLPLKKSGTVPAGLPYQNMTEVRNHLAVIIFSDDVRLDSGHVLERQIRSRVPDVNVMYVDPRMAKAVSPAALASVQAAEKVVVAVYVSPTAGKVVKGNGAAQNSVSMPPDSAELMRAILNAGQAKTVVLAMGNPYLAKDFPEVQNYLCTFSAAPVSEMSAAKAIFGEIEMRGRLPVTIPGVATRGTGASAMASK